MAVPKRKNISGSAPHIYDETDDSYSPISAATPMSVSSVSRYLTIRMDDGATYLYIGKAEIGSSTASAVWQVQRITQSDTTVLWADGNANFDNVWNNFASLSYS